MAAPLIPALIGLATTSVKRFVKDPDLADKITSDLTVRLLDSNDKTLEKAAKIIVAEAQGHSWLQRNWRPMLMLWFAALVGAHWLGFTPESLTEKEVEDLMDIVKIGIGGYVVSRGVEKGIKEWKKTDAA